MEPTPKAELNKAVADLNENRNIWATLGIPARLGLLSRMMDDTLAHADAFTRAACEQKHIDYDSPVAAEEVLGGPMAVLRNLRLLKKALGEIQQEGRPRLKDGALRTRKDGQVVAEVFPLDALDKMLYQGFRAEVWMQPGVAATDVKPTMARIYQKSKEPAQGKVALVLGAGNVSSIGPMDVLYKLFVENQVCILKMNPVNEYVGPFVEKWFAALIEGGFLRMAYGGADVGEYLVHHDGVHEIHITGSDRVHDIIVWGAPGEEQDANRRAKKMKIDKRITSELGCVTPLIIVPGEWSDKELAFQAENVATMVANNASFNCNAAKLLVTAKAWPQRQAFLDKVEETLRTIPKRFAYYPGSDRKYDGFLVAHPDAKPLETRTEEAIPWTLITGVDPKNTDDVVFKNEAWCGILAETALDGDDARAFLEGAVKFANDVVWGTLSCSVIVHPDTQRDLGEVMEQAVADLRYGSVAVNHWAAMSYALVVTTWGAHPGHTLDDVRSGIGVVHNTFMFERPQKSVIWGPFTMSPKPPWFSTHRNAHNVAKRLMKFEHSPSFWKVPGVAFSALKG